MGMAACRRCTFFNHFNRSHVRSICATTIVKAMYDTCPGAYVRPDHGRMIWKEVGRPGCGLYDRALGVAYLNGLWEAIDKAAKV